MAAGKLIRVSGKAIKHIEKHMDEHNWSWGKALDAALALDTYGLKGWVLPEDVYRTKKEAAVASMKRGAHKGLDLDDIEEPLKVREA